MESLDEELISESTSAAEAHYQTAEFQAELAKILAIISTRIHRRAIAISLEGTLVSNKHRFGKFSQHLKRPGANEIIEALIGTEKRNHVFIWTTSEPAVCQDAIKTSGLIIPPKVKIFNQKDTAEALIRKEAHREWGFSAKRDDFLNGKRKIPRYFPGNATLDFLLDHEADWHRESCELLYNGPLWLGHKKAHRDIDRIIPVREFKVTTETDLRKHFLDRGLFNVITTLAEKCQAIA